MGLKLSEWHWYVKKEQFYSVDMDIFFPTIFIIRDIFPPIFYYAHAVICRLQYNISVETDYIVHCLML